MSVPLRPQGGDPLGRIAFNFDGEGLIAIGTTVPTDTTAGYGKGCLFIDTDAAAGAQLFINEGSVNSSDFNAVVLPGVNLSGLTATATELNRLDDDLGVLPTLAGAGITGGTGTVYKTSVLKIGAIYISRIYIDLTGLASSTTDLDIIGFSTPAAHIGQITAARNGTIDAILMTCLEAPATGVTDIDLYSATEATGKFDDAISGLTETALITSGAAWTNGRQLGATAVPAANEYLYLTGGAGGTAATYTAGKFLIELIGI